MLELAERIWFGMCLTLGRLLRSGRYSKVRIIQRDGGREARKRRLVYAPLLLWLGGPLFRVLGAGVRVLGQADWEERERRLYGRLHGTSVRVDADGTLILPWLPGATLASLLEDPNADEPLRRTAVQLAVVALAELHGSGFTHGDAMAENVMIDLDAGVARWFDFETVHDSKRQIAWQRADDLRALLATCLVRTIPEKRAETLQLIIDAYAADEVTRAVAAGFTSVFQRRLVLHLGQAPLSFESFRDIKRVLQSRSASVAARATEVCRGR